MDAYALTERCETLEEENKRLRELLAPRVGFPVEWGLTRTQSAVLSTIYNAPGHFQTQTAIRHAACRNAFSVNIILVHICHLRKKLQPFGIEIETRWGDGYALNQASADIISAAIGGAA